jgi:dienelactone hydrolase
MEKISLFDYNSAADLQVVQHSVEKRGNTSIMDITFDGGSAAHKTNRAYLVTPDGKGPFAGILWVHWLGEPETTNRTQYLQEAISLAEKGVVSLLVDAMWSAPDWYGNRIPEEDYDNSIAQVIALRRAMDVLLAQPNVDPSRIGVVGHDYGGMYSTLMAGTDPRAKTYVLIAVVPSLYDWAFFVRQPQSKVDYVRQNAVFELTDFISRVNNASVLFQFAKDDPYISRTQQQIFFHAANEPKSFKVYDAADHSMELPEIEADRDEWLIKELGLA